MISSNGLIIIEMVSSETVDRGTVLFILKGETCLNGICHGAFGEVYGRSFVCFLGGVVRLSPPKKVLCIIRINCHGINIWEKRLFYYFTYIHIICLLTVITGVHLFCFLTGNGLFHQFLAVYYQPRLAITLLVERNFIIIALIHQHIAH